MARKKKRLFEVELFDTSVPLFDPRKLVWRGVKTGRFQLEAIRKAAKMFPQINFGEWRTPKRKHSRYVFLTKEVK